MSSYERPITRSLYVTVLSKEDPSPLAPESDDEKARDEKPEAEEAKSKPADEQKPTNGSKTSEGEKKSAPVPVKIDLEGLDQRILALPVPARDYRNLQAVENKLFYLETLPNQPIDTEIYLRFS